MCIFLAYLLRKARAVSSSPGSNPGPEPRGPCTSCTVGLRLPLPDAAPVCFGRLPAGLVEKGKVSKAVLVPRVCVRTCIPDGAKKELQYG